jgi:hypothetical protein
LGAGTDLTVVVQGPVHAYQDRPQEVGITRRCLASVRQHLPGARLVLSTWEGQDTAGLDCDELVLSADPGGNIVSWDAAGVPRRLNHNRQIVSTVAGLRRATSGYAMKLRSDNVLTGTGFLTIQQQFPRRAAGCRWLEEHVVLVNTFARRYSKGYRVAFHPSDFFAYGRTADLLALWDIPLFADLPADPYFRAIGYLYHPGAPEFERDTMQELILRWVNKHQPVALDHLLDGGRPMLRLWELILANNLILAEPGRIGLYLGRKFSEGVRVARPAARAAFYSFGDWQRLYRRHCDPAFRVSEAPGERLRLWWLRATRVWPKRPGGAFQRIKRRLRFHWAGLRYRLRRPAR